MKTNKEILDEFGKYVSQNVFDTTYGSIVEVFNKTCPNLLMKNLIDLFNKFSDDEKEIIKTYIYGLIEGTLFEFLKIFEENPKYKIIFEENEQQIDLTKISEMLKAEPLGEDGWIQKFSKFKDSID